MTRKATHTLCFDLLITIVAAVRAERHAAHRGGVCGRIPEHGAALPAGPPQHLLRDTIHLRSAERVRIPLNTIGYTGRMGLCHSQHCPREEWGCVVLNTVHKERVWVILFFPFLM